MEWYMQWELDFLYFLQGIHNPVLDKVMVAITFLGDVGIFWILLTIVMLLTKKYRRCGIGMAISLVLMLLVGDVVLKHLFMRSRPCWIDTSVGLLVQLPKDYSFPSGHTFASFVSAVTIFLHYKKEGIAALVLAALISFSRLYLFVHFPTDVLTSIVLGTGVAVLVWFLMNRYEARKKSGEEVLAEQAAAGQEQD